MNTCSCTLSRHMGDLCIDSCGARLRKLVFGSGTEKAEMFQGLPQEPKASPDSGADHTEAANARSDAKPGVDTDKQTPRNHGWHGADAFPGAQQVDVPYPTLCAGVGCRECHSRTLFEKKPSVVVCFVGWALIQGTVFRMQRLR